MLDSSKVVGTPPYLVGLIINLVDLKLILINNNKSACMKRGVIVANLENKPQFSFRQPIGIIAGIEKPSHLSQCNL